MGANGTVPLLKKMSQPVNSSCDACGGKQGSVCCYDATGKLLSSQCGDGTVCDSSSHFCHPGGSQGLKWGDPCPSTMVGKPCDASVPNVTCQEYQSSTSCRCAENYKPCSADGSSVCDPGS